MGEAAIVLAATAAFSLSIIFGPPAIRHLTRLKFGQTVRADGPKHHAGKTGTPTMGGVIILASAVIATVLFSPGYERAAWALFATLSFGLVGLVDDFIKIQTRRSLGLKARQKLAAQIVIAALIALYAMTNPALGTRLAVPYLSYPPISLGTIDLGWLYLPFVVFFMVGFSNAVNLTDGLDGLAAGTTAIAALAYVVIAVAKGDMEMAVFAAAVAAACLGFSWFNAHPAQIFMGDTGSLALGGALAAMAVLTKTELTLVIVGGVFVAETFSVAAQVASFRLTGKRIFKMSPLHHHFELSGWAETKVVVRFWIIAAFLAVLGLAGTGIWS